MINIPKTTGIRTTTVFSLKPLPASLAGLPPITAGAQILADTGLEKPDELVSGLLHQGTKGVLGSASKAGKTWILLDLALSVATGNEFIRHKTLQGKVLFINFEIKEAFIKERLKALMERRRISDCGEFEFWNLRGKITDFEALTAKIITETEGKNYKLIILDPIYKAMIGRSENGAGGVGNLCYQLERMAERTGAAVFFSHHFPKGNIKKKATIDRLSGSGVFARDADTIVTLTEHTEPNCYTVEMVLRNLPHQPAFVVEWHYPIMVAREDLDPEDTALNNNNAFDNGKGLIELLRPGPLPGKDWETKALALGLSRATYFRTKAKLKESGYITFDEETEAWSLVNELEPVSQNQE